MLLRTIPEAYRETMAERGRVERVDYATSDEKRLQKHALVYVPRGYDDTDAPYNTFYLIHGGGGNQKSFFTESFLSMLDHMNAAGELAPALVVSPSYYDTEDAGNDIAASGKAVAAFARELKADIIPAVERRYRTHAAAADPACLRASRAHRAIGGFSMGSVATWYAFLDGLDAFRWFMPLSGDCWLYGELGGFSHADETARTLSEAVSRQGFTPADFRIHAVTGSQDIACPNESAQIDAMRKYPEVFRFGENIDYDILEGGVHDYPDIQRYIYNALPSFFQ